MTRKNTQTCGEYSITAIPDASNNMMKMVVRRDSETILEETFFASDYDCGYFRTQATYDDMEDFLKEHRVTLPWSEAAKVADSEGDTPKPVDLNIADFPVVRGYVRDEGKAAVYACTGGLSILYLTGELPNPALEALKGANREQTIGWLVEWWHAVRTMEIRAGGHVHRFGLLDGKITKFSSR